MSLSLVKAVRWEDEQRPRPEAGDWDAGEEELLSVDVVANLRRIMRENAVLAEIFTGVEGFHTTQGFQTAEALEKAFAGELASVEPSVVEERVTKAYELYKTEIEMHGITNKQLKELFALVWIYSRLTHPVNGLLEHVIAEMEGADDARTFASGLGAIESVIRQFSKPSSKGEHGEYVDGDTIVVVGNVYGGTNAQFKNICEETGRKVIFYTLAEFQDLFESGKKLPKDTGLVFMEGSNNPTLAVSPIGDASVMAKEVGAKLVCDMTFTPLTVQAMDHGADLVLHSMTKYIGGKSEDLGGVVAGSQEDMDQLIGLHGGRRMLGGAVMAPRVAGEFLQNIMNMPERLYWGSKNARAVSNMAKQLRFDAKTVEDYPEYENLRNPDLPEDVTNGMVALYLDTAEQANAFVNAMIRRGIGLGAVSLGATTTYYCIPARTTHSEMTPEEQLKQGVTPGLVRISCGTEKNLPEIVEEVLLELRGPHTGGEAMAA